MEFTSRGGHGAAQNQPAAPHGGGRRKHIDWITKTVRFELFIVIVGSALLLSAVSLWLATGNYKNAEAKQINSKEYQAVFLANNQVYFGKISDLNNKFVVIKDVFYIENQSSQTNSSNNNYTLRKLGVTELHAPEDEMVINRDQVTFWENLKDSGQVVSKIKEYKANPNAANQSSSNSSSTSQTPSASQSTTSTTNKP